MNQENLWKSCETTHTQLMSGTFCRAQITTSGSSVLWNEQIADCYYNYATDYRRPGGDVESNLDEVENFFRSRGRAPSIYLSPNELYGLMEFALINRGYLPNCSESWYIRTDDLLVDEGIPEGATFMEVTTPQQAELFTALFDASYSSLTGYVASGLSNNYRACVSSVVADKSRFRSLIVQYEGEPAGCVSIGGIEDVAGIYTLGVIPKFRGLGLGRGLVIQAMTEAFNRGARVVFGQSDHIATSDRNVFISAGFTRQFLGRWYTASLESVN